MSARTALITGITGQDGAYLTAFLLTRGYRVHGLRRRTSSDNTGRLTALLGSRPDGLVLHTGDLADLGCLTALLGAIVPDEIYHLAAQSHVHESFASPIATANANALGTLRLLEAIRLAGLATATRLFNASSSELFGNPAEIPQSEATPFAPRSPYAAAKLYAHATVRLYREAYGLYACNGILFNHESPLRGPDFVTRKIVRAAASDTDVPLTLGNLNAVRDWGHARDTVRGIWLMLQQPQPDDYVLAIGEGRTVRSFVEAAFACAGRQVRWRGDGLDEEGFDAASGATLVRVDPILFRPAEVDALVGDAGKAHATLGWRPKTTFADLVHEMVNAEMAVVHHYGSARAFTLPA